MKYRARIQFRGPQPWAKEDGPPWWLVHWFVRTEPPMQQYDLLVKSFQTWYRDTNWAFE
jgi:hypothetical protein